MLNKSLPKAPPKFVIYKCNNYGAAGSRYGNQINPVYLYIIYILHVSDQSLFGCKSDIYTLQLKRYAFESVQSFYLTVHSASF